MARIVEDTKPVRKSSSSQEKASPDKKRTPKKMTKKVVKKDARKSKPEKSSKGTRGRGSNKGKTSGLRYKPCWVQVFKDNAKAPVAQRKTDAEIFKYMKSEFPDKKARTLRDESGVILARRRYNAGKFTKGDIPSPLSTAYDEKGKAIESKLSRAKDGDEEGRRRGFPGKTGGRKSRPVRK